MYKRIVVPLDGSALAAKALEYAANLAKSNDTPLFLIRAVDPSLVQTMSATGIRPGFGLTNEAFENEDRIARDYLLREVTQLKSSGITTTSDVIWGQAAKVVADALHDTDLLVMSSHGRTGPKRWFVGSVAEDILKRTTVPVFLIRQAGEGSQP